MARRKFFLTVSYEMPTLGFHVSDGSPLAEKVKKKAEQLHDGKVSAYVRSVVERDLSGESSAPDALSPTVLVDLCKRLNGELDALTLEKHLLNPSQYDQPHLLQAMLYGLLEFFERGGAFSGADEDNTRPCISNAQSSSSQVVPCRDVLAATKEKMHRLSAKTEHKKQPVR